ncbi:helix-turn-helix domain-containing protein [Streptomyces europaeiscabiei]|uniref:helix-turn-helix domain-containing protein n=1 Tax=Streptomyces europaeiscabiei TaxID=146819 RepID=UPI0038F65198
MSENVILRRRMKELGLKQEELIDQLNDALRDVTGRQGNISERTVRNWLAGAHRRPIGRTCLALERVFGCPVGELGFSAPRSMQHPPEDSVRRRKFFASTAGTAVTAVPFIKQQRSVGMSDVARAAAGMDALVAADDRRGGHTALASAALKCRAEVLDLQRRNASERVRRALYTLATEYTNMTAWFYIDLRDLDLAQKYLHESTTFAGLSQDPHTQMRVWNNMTFLARQRKNFPEALAAAQAAQASAAARRDPFFTSLGHVRAALAHADLGDTRASQRSLGSAQEALLKAPEEQRPRWTAFYGKAELNHLAALILNQNRKSAEAEAMAHRALAGIPLEFRRNRALATCQLAIAQLQQEEPEQATETAASVFTIMDGTPLPGRMRTQIGDFHRNLLHLTPWSTCARDWADRMRDEWSRA